MHAHRAYNPLFNINASVNFTLVIGKNHQQTKCLKYKIAHTSLHEFIGFKPIAKKNGSCNLTNLQPWTDGAALSGLLISYHLGMVYASFYLQQKTLRAGCPQTGDKTLICQNAILEENEERKYTANMMLSTL